MNLSDIKKEYNAVFSLGQNCWPAWALYQLELSPFFGVIDFMLSPSLEKVNVLLQNRFDRFLNFENLSFISFWDDDAKLRLRDNLYEIDSCHDFKTDVNTPTSWPSYTEIKLNYEHRINRFLATIETAESILFIRTGGTYEEACSLEQIFISNRYTYILCPVTNSCRYTNYHPRRLGITTCLRYEMSYYGCIPIQ